MSKPRMFEITMKRSLTQSRTVRVLGTSMTAAERRALAIVRDETLPGDEEDGGEWEFTSEDAVRVTRAAVTP